MSDSSVSSSKRSRRAFTSAFKAEVVLFLLTGVKTQAELCREHELSPSLLIQWKDAFLSNAAAAFETKEAASADSARVSELERALGRATLENEILKKASSLLSQRQKNGGRS